MKIRKKYSTCDLTKVLRGLLVYDIPLQFLYSKGQVAAPITFFNMKKTIILARPLQIPNNWPPYMNVFLQSVSEMICKVDCFE